MTQAFREHSDHSESTEKALREYFKSNQREREKSDFVILLEPKILRLVIKPASVFQANPVIQSSKSVGKNFKENVPRLKRAGSTPKWSIFMEQPSRTLSTSMQFSK